MLHGLDIFAGIFAWSKCRHSARTLSESILMMLQLSSFWC